MNDIVKCTNCKQPLTPRELDRDAWRVQNKLEPLQLCTPCDNDFHDDYR